jgi:solute carrier family 35 protein E1
MLFLSGIFYHLYNQVSYQALTNITPVTFSVGNALKRVAVIVASVIYFRNPVSPLNAAGSALALLGAYLYTKASESKKSAAAPTAMTKADRSYSAYNEQFIQTTGLTGLTLEEFDV